MKIHHSRALISLGNVMGNELQLIIHEMLAYNRKVNVIRIDVSRKRDSADLVFQEKISETLPKNCKNRQKTTEWMTSAAICENKHP